MIDISLDKESSLCTIGLRFASDTARGALHQASSGMQCSLSE